MIQSQLGCMVERCYSKKQKLSGQRRTISSSTSANCVMTTKSAKTLCHCIKLCLYIIRMLNDHLVEVYNVPIDRYLTHRSVPTGPPKM